MNGKALIGTDAGPFNEYIDSYIRKHTDTAYDKDGILGSKGMLNKKLLQILFELGRKYYEAAIPKSGDPAYYYKDKIFQYVENNKIHLEDAIHTFEYFASYIAAYTLSLVPNEIKLSGEMILFGGGWKNPIIRNSFDEIKIDKKDNARYRRIDPVDACIDAHYLELKYKTTDPGELMDDYLASMGWI